MHEFSVAEGMVTAIEGSVRSPAKLVSVRVTIGPLAGISGEVLAFCFPEVANARGFGKPVLAITYVQARMQCVPCTCEYLVDSVYVTCPSCGSLDRLVLSGREFMIDSVEVEE